MNIYKYKLDSDKKILSLPEEAVILSVASQNNELCLWALVDPEKNKKDRLFRVFTTGEDIPQQMFLNYSFIGTGHTNNGLSITYSSYYN